MMKIHYCNTLKHQRDTELLNFYEVHRFWNVINWIKIESIYFWYWNHVKQLLEGKTKYDNDGISFKRNILSAFVWYSILKGETE